MTYECDVVIIGAGPSGAVAGAMLAAAGRRVTVLERDEFPRFSIGESLLPQCMDYLDEAGLLDVIQEAGFQPKDGAVFHWRDNEFSFNFNEKWTPGWGTTYQVQRASFDKLLADAAANKGVDIRYGCQVLAARLSQDDAVLDYQDQNGDRSTIHARFCLDASGFGRVLARLQSLEQPSTLPPRTSFFTHVIDRIDDAGFDRQKILITVHPEKRDIWYWLIPFSDGTSSIGVVGEPVYFESDPDADTSLWRLISEDPGLARLLKNAEACRDTGTMIGYSASVTSLHGPGFALLGNAGEFLDPVFSSGVTIALHSSCLAARLLNRQLDGGTVDWQTDFTGKLMPGIETFRCFVESWYRRELQDIIFYPEPEPQLGKMISAVLAGYAWDGSNPFVAEPKRRLAALAQVCAP